MPSIKFVAALFLFFSIAFLKQATAQDTLPKPAFGSGAFEQAAAKTEKLLQLNWDNDNLVLNKDWEERLKEEKKNKVMDERERQRMINQFVLRGLPEPEAKEVTEKLLKHDVNPFDRNGFRMHRRRKQPAVKRAFFDIASASHSSSSSGNAMSFNSRTLSAEANTKPDDVWFRFTEPQGDERSFELANNGQGKLKFEFSFGELFVRLMQTERGKTKLTWIFQDKIDIYTGDSFSDFVKRNPQATEKLLYPLWDQLGIKKPVKN